MVWMIIFIIVFLIAMIKVGIQVTYREKNFRLTLLISKYKLVLLGENKPKRAKKSKKSKAAKQTPAKAKAEKAKKKGNILQNPWVQAVLEYWSDILELIGRILKSPTLDILRLQIWVGGGDSEKCAMTYGKICALLGGILPAVENTFGIRKRQINVWCCYDRTSIDIEAETAITIRIHEIFALVFALLGLGIKILLQARKYKKAVQNYESSSS